MAYFLGFNFSVNARELNAHHAKTLFVMFYPPVPFDPFQQHEKELADRALRT